MIVAACVDNAFGLRFRGRRLSKDAKAREKLLTLSGGQLRMRPYSARQFAQPVSGSEDYLSGAKAGDWCFAEDCSYLEFAEQIEQILLIRWNRNYPADEFFRFPGQWRLVHTEDFPGTSHEILTMEVYEPCKKQT